MIRFTFNSTQTDQAVPSDIRSVCIAAAALAGWGEGVVIEGKQLSGSAWLFIAQGEVVTAEVVP
jgi:hypothetical protein